MVPQNRLHTGAERGAFLYRIQLYACCRTKQMSEKDQISDLTLHVRTYIQITIEYRYHGYEFIFLPS